MADKIDQLEFNGYTWDIDLPPDATPSIYSLEISNGITPSTNQGCNLGSSQKEFQTVYSRGIYSSNSDLIISADGGDYDLELESSYIYVNATNYISIVSADEIFIESSNEYIYLKTAGSNFYAGFDTSLLETGRLFTFPNDSGELALKKMYQHNIYLVINNGGTTKYVYFDFQSPKQTYNNIIEVVSECCGEWRYFNSNVIITTGNVRDVFFRVQFATSKSGNTYYFYWGYGYGISWNTASPSNQVCFDMGYSETSTVTQFYDTSTQIR